MIKEKEVEQMGGPYEIRNWVLSFPSGNMMVEGCVHGNPNFPTGRVIFSSNVKDVTLEEDKLVVETLNSVYHCPLAQVNPVDAPTKEYFLEKFPNQAERWEELFQNHSQLPEISLEGADSLPDGAFILALTPVRTYLFQGLYQKRADGYHWVLRSPYVHLGMFTDSVLCTAENFDVRYFPRGSNDGVEFYVQRLHENKEKYAKPSLFYVMNVGESPIFVDTNTLEPGQIYTILEKNAIPDLTADTGLEGLLTEESTEETDTELEVELYWNDDATEELTEVPMDDEIPEQVPVKMEMPQAVKLPEEEAYFQDEDDEFPPEEIPAEILRNLEKMDAAIAPRPVSEVEDFLGDDVEELDLENNGGIFKNLPPEDTSWALESLSDLVQQGDTKQGATPVTLTLDPEPKS